MKAQRGQTMIASLIVMAIILILAVFLLRGYTNGHLGTGSARKDKLGNTIPGAAIAGAKDDVCRSNLSQDRAAIQIYHTTNGDEGFPPTMDDFRLGNDFEYCPLGHEKYVYNPQTGEIHCPHPGHEKF